MPAKRLVIRGRVQGVGYRYAMVDAAMASGVTGWVRNRRDGSVEALVQGEPAAIESIVAWCRRGPSTSRVSAIDEIEATDELVTGFELRPTI
jgi:acylphosphatase